MTLFPNPDSIRSQKKSKRKFTGSRPVRRARRRLAISTQGQINITEYRKAHFVSDAKAHIPGALQYH